MYAPQESADAELLAERIVPRLQHANSAVVLSAVRAILYLINYVQKEEVSSNLLKKLGPPLGKAKTKKKKKIILKYKEPDILIIRMNGQLVLYRILFSDR